MIECRQFLGAGDSMIENGRDQAIDRLGVCDALQPIVDDSDLHAVGVSGNPNGKPKGTRHRVTVLAENLMQDEAKDIVRAVLEAAKGGDMTAARLIMERIFPVRKRRPIYLE